MRRARALHVRQVCEASSVWNRMCRSVYSWWGHVVRRPELPPAAPADWRGHRWWRTVQVLYREGAVQQPHPRKNWVRQGLGPPGSGGLL